MPLQEIPLATSLQAYDQAQPTVGVSLTTAQGNQIDSGPLMKNFIAHKTADQKYTITQRPRIYVETAAPTTPSVTEMIGQGVHYLPNGTKLIIQDGELTYDGTAVRQSIGTFSTNFAGDANNLDITGHGLVVGETVRLTTTGTLPAPLAVNTTYYVVTVNGVDDIEISASLGGSPVTLTDNGSGTHTLHRIPKTSARAYFSDYDTDKCAIKVDDELWIYNDATNALTQVTTGWTGASEIETLSPVEGMVYLDDYLFILTDAGTIFNSKNNDFTNWDDSTDFITAERMADRGKAIIRHKDHIAVFGQHTIEFFYDAANAVGSPLTRRTDIFHTVGTHDGKSVASLRDTICFIGQDEGSNYGIYVVKGFEAVKVSDTLADLAIRNAVTGANSTIGTCFSAGGKDFYCVVFLHSNSQVTATKDQKFKAFVYDLTDKILMEWDTDLVSEGFMPVSVTGVDGGEARVINYSGEVFTFPKDTIAQDQDSPGATTATIDCLLRTYPINFGVGARKFWNRLFISGHHNQDTAASGAAIDIYWSDDGGATTNVASKRTETLTDEQRIVLGGLGSSRHRTWYIGTSTTVKVWLQDMTLDVDLGDN